MRLTVLKTTFLLFALLGIAFIPFPFSVFPYQITISQFLFGDIIHFIATDLFSLTHNYQKITSDSSSLLILILLLFVIAAMCSILLSYSKKWKENESKIFSLITTIVCYYLTLQLLNYGIDKVFKAQFYLPEPNILYTPFGQLDKDILYWSTMGTSYSYNIILGTIEVLTALLLVFRKTRVLGLLFCCGVFINVIAVNFSFDISVKFYSSFLFSITLICLAPFLSKLYRFFVLQKNTRLNYNQIFFSFSKHTYLKPYLKTFIILVMLFEVLHPFALSGNYNDDNAARPFLHGAYSIEGETNFKRLFIHRDGYLIFQDDNDLMIDYKLDINSTELTLTDYNLNTQTIGYFYNNNQLTLNYSFEGKEQQLKCKALNCKVLPVLQNNFHWFVDDI